MIQFVFICILFISMLPFCFIYSTYNSEQVHTHIQTMEGVCPHLFFVVSKQISIFNPVNLIMIVIFSMCFPGARYTLEAMKCERSLRPIEKVLWRMHCEYT